MGSTYTVPRSAKGESRIFYIFNMQSLATTAVMAFIGFLVTKLIGIIAELSLIPMILTIVAFGGVGFVIGAAKIPDIPLMGPFQKAGGEQILDIAIRWVSFRKKKKMYIYGINRKPNLDEKTGDVKKGKGNTDILSSITKAISK